MTVLLRGWQAGDEDAAVRWSQDTAFCLANGWTVGLEPEYVRQWWLERAADSPELCMIQVDGVVVGYAEWQAVQGDVAELGIAIGDSGVWGQGIGTAAGKLMLARAFEGLGLTRVWAEVHATNTRSLALMQKLGLREVGRAGQDEYQGEVVPLVQFELLASEWRGLRV